MNAETTIRLAMLPTPRTRVLHMAGLLVLLGLDLLMITLRYDTSVVFHINFWTMKHPAVSSPPAGAVA